MAENTQTAPPTNTPSGYGWCAWHQNYARGVRLVQAIEQSSSENGSLFACRPCRPCRDIYDLVPLADQS